MDVVRGELVEKELTAFIEKRDRQRRQTEGERRAEEAWVESERRHNARRRDANRLAWCAYFSHLAGTLRARAEDYERRAALLEDRGEGGLLG